MNVHHIVRTNVSFHLAQRFLETATTRCRQRFRPTSVMMTSESVIFAARMIFSLIHW